jgi:hypothetical protein
MNESKKWNLGYASERERKKRENCEWIEKTLMLYVVLVDSFEVTQNKNLCLCLGWNERKEKVRKRKETIITTVCD